MGGWEIAISFFPGRSLYSLCSCRRYCPYCYYCCFCLCCVGASSLYIYRLSSAILAAAVLLLYYADAAETLLFFHRSLSWNHTSPTTLFSDISSAKLQTILTFLYFGLLLTKFCVFSKIIASSPGEGGGNRRFSLVPFSLPPRSVSRLLYVADLPSFPDPLPRQPEAHSEAAFHGCSYHYSTSLHPIWSLAPSVY